MSQSRIFKSPLLEKIAHTNTLVAIAVYLVISIAVVVYGFMELEHSVLLGICLVLGGLLFFTFIEYGFHRFLYHSGENYKDEKNWQYKIHGVHHDHPKEKDILAMPIPLALFLSGAFYGLFYLLMGESSIFFFPGFLSGYAAYLYVHYKVHTSLPPNNIFRYLWTHHALHHYVHDDKAFGVSSPIWDIIFQTMPPKKDRMNQRQP